MEVKAIYATKGGYSCAKGCYINYSISYIIHTLWNSDFPSRYGAVRFKAH